MERIDIAVKAEDMQIIAEQAHSTLIAIVEAIYRGDNAVETYEWAFAGLSNMTHQLRTGLEALTNEAFKEKETA